MCRARGRHQPLFAMTNDEFLLWRVSSGGASIECVMISCCEGAELQLRRDGAIVLRELFPSKSDLHERSRQLKREWLTADG